MRDGHFMLNWLGYVISGRFRMYPVRRWWPEFSFCADRKIDDD